MIFFDEIDSIATTRSANEHEGSRRLKNELFIQMDRNDDVLVLAATNLPWELDIAFSRRFESKIYIGLPDLNARTTMLKKKFKSIPNTLSEQNLVEIASMLESYSGADLSVIEKRICYLRIRKAQDSTHFRYDAKKEKYVPCDATHPDSLVTKIENIPHYLVELPLVEKQDAINALNCYGAPSVTLDDIKKYEEYETKQKYAQR